MVVDVFDAFGGFAGQTRGIEVVDVVIVAVEQVKDIDEGAEAPELLAGAQVEDERAFRLDAPVLDERELAEVARA